MSIPSGKSNARRAEAIRILSLRAPYKNNGKCLVCGREVRGLAKNRSKYCFVCSVGLSNARTLEERIFFIKDRLKDVPAFENHFRLLEMEGKHAIQCKLCGLISYHPKDIEHKYCGNCHVFLDDI